MLCIFLFTAVITGEVFDNLTTMPLSAHVLLPDIDRTIVCDSSGRFSIRHVKIDTLFLIVSHIGYKEETLVVNNISTDTLHLTIGLTELPIPIEPINITEIWTPWDGEKIEQEEFQTMPGAEKDIFKAVQTLPGVTMASDFLGLIFVRGGDVDENLVFMDNIEVLWPYHFFGAGSVFNADLIENFYFHAGYFPSYYGNAVSSVLDIRTKKPTNTITGTMSLDVIEANWLYLCPISEKITCTFSSKRNYLDILLDKLGVVEDILLPYYADNQACIRAHGTWGTLGLHGIHTNEKTQIETSIADERFDLDIDGNSSVIGAFWNTPETHAVKASIWLSYNDVFRYVKGEVPAHAEVSQEKIHESKSGAGGSIQFDTEMMSLEIGTGFGTYTFQHAGAKIEDLLYGFSALDYTLEVDTTDQWHYLYASQEFNVLSPLHCEIGERVDWFPVIKKPLFLPRIKITYVHNPQVFCGFGHYSQLPPLEYELENPEPMYAKCLNIGTEYVVGSAYAAKLELYHKQYHNLVTVNSSYTFSTRGFGYASGIELSIRKHKYDNVFGWVSYAYSFGERSSPYDSIPDIIHTQRPHIFSFFIGSTLPQGFEISIRYHIASGSTYAEVIGKEWDIWRECWLPVYAPEKTRFSSYERLDLHAEKNFQICGLRGSVYITMLNVTNHRNIQTYLYNSDYSLRKALYMMPRIPIVGIRMHF
jgi:hypothetical protein